MNVLTLDNCLTGTDAPIKRVIMPSCPELLRARGSPPMAGGAASRLPWRGAAPWLAVSSTCCQRAGRRAGEMLAMEVLHEADY